MTYIVSHDCNPNYPRPGREKASKPVLLSDFPEGPAAQFLFLFCNYVPINLLLAQFAFIHF